ncbi:ADP-heptose--LPS heptosyltransferase [Gallibacterium genomosp. 3]|uniref:lipopolysaccharide heptosyltransferase II n=1 Tax=Gallibacterium genomosp. 3 TaxID=505345 RepID=A0A1A7PUA9_9PAST|nr:lipopolysaccharide heptosyltransferase II [Gallibacterium genomosp. 3]OBX04750.1 ADP-heptose--LPS heptosyltransferase [Gallibacterium genomosp. 3]
MKILVIGPSWVGDMMMSHSLYQMLKQRYPTCEIDVLAPNWCRALLSRMPEVNQALAMPIGHGEFNLSQRYQIGKSLRGQYDLAIVLPNSLKSALIPLFAKIPLRRGWKGESRYLLLNDLRSNKRDYPLMVQRYIALAFEKGEVPVAKDLPLPYPYLQTEPAQVTVTLQQFSQRFSFDPQRTIIGFCPGAEFGPAKRWPHYHYANLAKLLIQRGHQICLFGSAKDHAVGEEIRASLSEAEQPYCINLAGETSLPEAINLISSCTAVVSNDSGLMHIAAALQRPLVAVYGPTSPEYTPPLAEKVKIIRLIRGGLIKVRKSKDSQEGYHQSLIDIQPEIVLNALDELL